MERDQHSHVCWNQFMRTVNIGDLKARLSAHIQYMRDGEELLVCDRNKPVARIVPCSADDEPERERRLIAPDILVPPEKEAAVAVTGACRKRVG
jgi:antitoxin (DNA-binding transcriptional repressor) of toxin-antitoxin stability system